MSEPILLLSLLAICHCRTPRWVLHASRHWFVWQDRGLVIVVLTRRRRAPALMVRTVDFMKSLAATEFVETSFNYAWFIYDFSWNVRQPANIWADVRDKSAIIEILLEKFCFIRGNWWALISNIGWHDRSWTILNGKLTMLELLNIY